MASTGQLLFDESGQPFIVIKEQESQKRITGVEALKVLKILKKNIYFDLESYFGC